MKTALTMSVSFLITMLVMTEASNRMTMGHNSRPDWIMQEDSSMQNYMRHSDSTCQRLQNLLANDEQPRSWLPIFRRDYKHMETMMYAAEMRAVRFPKMG